MAAMDENPYTWGKQSLDITGKVVSLSFKSRGKKLLVAHLDKGDPIDIRIPRDAPVEPPERFTYNCSIHNEWRVHKMLVDKNGSAANVEVGTLGSNREFVVYVRRRKAPTVTEFDWRVFSPNKNADDGRFNTSLNQTFQNGTEQRAETTDTDTKSSGKSSNSMEKLNETEKEERHVTHVSQYLNTEGSKVSLFLSETKLFVGTYFIGIHFKTSNHYASCDQEDYNITYTLRTFKSKCLYWNEEFQNWKDDGCEACMNYNRIQGIQGGLT